MILIKIFPPGNRIPGKFSFIYGKVKLKRWWFLKLATLPLYLTLVTLSGYIVFQIHD